MIPARAGSKGVPNKNIRLINNKPLVYYAIKNALCSTWVTDVVISTDSEEVEAVAREMGVHVKQRDELLATDAVTLDAVVYDAAKEYEAEYVVTLQPTSPTLQVETLDKAISYCIQEDYDTVISAVNRPHLAWTKDIQGTITPSYAKRLNRQYLPPYYMETGAFLISKRKVITQDSRIGHKVNVFEIEEDEAIDIDSFNDIVLATEILARKKVGFYVNGNNKRGVGHVYRALELADELFTKPDIYYDMNQTDKKIFGRTTHRIIGVDGIGELLSIVKERRYDIFINDILSTSIDYMIAFKQALGGGKIVNFEDMGEGANIADLVINSLYGESEIRNLKYGSDYYIAPKLFMIYNPIQIRERIERVFICFGGADPQNYTDAVLSIIQKPKYANLHFDVVLGRAKTNAEALLGMASERISVYFDVKNMPEIMKRCDIGITSRGRTAFELAMLGIPTIAMAQNEREGKHGFIDVDNGFHYLGIRPSDYVIESTIDLFVKMGMDDRKGIQQQLLSHDFRNGRRRVINLIESL